MLPFLEVDHLPSSSSFYSAIIQPLGLRYLTTEDGHFPSITYGHPSSASPVFQIRQVSSRDRPLITARLVLSAPSAAAADQAYQFALRADPDPDPWDTRPRHLPENAPSGVSARRVTTNSGGTRILITDFVGNMMEIVYQLPPEYPPDHDGPTLRVTQSTDKEATDIMDWSRNVATSSAMLYAGSNSASGAHGRQSSRRSYARDPEADDQPHPRLRRTVTTGSSGYEPAASARQNSNGLSAGALVSTILAATALGGAAYYNMAKGDKHRSDRQEYDKPSLPRRASQRDKHDAYSESRPRHREVERTVEVYSPVTPPASDYRQEYDKLSLARRTSQRDKHDAYSESRSRRIEVERTVEEYSPITPPASDYRQYSSEYIPRHAEVEPPRSRDVDDAYGESRSRRISPRSRASSARPRSESASYQELYVNEELEHRSFAASRSSRHPPIVQRSYTSGLPDRDSQVSTRSRRSNSTVRAPPPDAYYAPTHTGSFSRSRSQLSSRATSTADTAYETTRVYSREGSHVSAWKVPLPASHAPSYASARNVPLPESRAPTRLSSYDDEDKLAEMMARTHISANKASRSHSRSQSYIPADEYPPRPRGQVTYVRAQDVPLPPSNVGSSHARWEDSQDDADSVVPSDSISNTGREDRGRGRGRSRY